MGETEVGPPERLPFCLLQKGLKVGWGSKDIESSKSILVFLLKDLRPGRAQVSLLMDGHTRLSTYRSRAGHPYKRTL